MLGDGMNPRRWPMAAAALMLLAVPVAEAADEVTADEVAAWLTDWTTGTLAQRRQAEHRLWADPHASAQALEAWIDNHPGDDRLPAALELLRRGRRPEQLARVVIRLLDDSRRSDDWPHAATAAQGLPAELLAKPLMERLDLSRAVPQNTALLAALTHLKQVPPEALATLLPWWVADPPELRASVHEVSARAVFDRPGDEPWELAAWREGLDAVDQRLLERGLEKLAEDRETEHAGLRQAAQRLSLALGQIEPVLLQDLRIVAVSHATEESPVDNLLNGQAGSREAQDQWRSRADGSYPWVVIDLGRTSTVTHLEIVNFNQVRETQLGLRRLAIFVGETPRFVEASRVTELPRASEEEELKEMLQRIELPATSGRYLVLRGESTHHDGKDGGLNVVRVYGLPH